ncbi:hypothetical protein phiAS5_ORF0150 [Aeromonas phage phiAS5]|uniref:Uncharacterized protein n=1 Tax=Aeromonas phage phiAS5 TaxID=879630 RepID=E1A2P7_9CAUD|nr:hypothetical protein phiAS5_ORF0150 [Aeromonas phage phiAS5]ADM79993.1 hypothetical protein phiAS5_ORF0150 [Aeromonas phage phiAS5]
MFENIADVYLDVEFWILSNKQMEHEVKTTYQQLVATFGEERLTRIINNFDPYWIAWKE